MVTRNTRTRKSVAASLGSWLAGLRGAAELRAKTPDQREDLGLTLADLDRMA
jgi:hypothetical protein